MTTREDLEQLSTKELHDRAIDRAKHHLDVGFLWDLVKALPVAEEIVGETTSAARSTSPGRSR